MAKRESKKNIVLNEITLLIVITIILFVLEGLHWISRGFALSPTNAYIAFGALAQIMTLVFVMYIAFMMAKKR